MNDNNMYSETIDELLEKWDKGDTIFTIECGGLGPGYEQCIQLMAIEFARACKDMKDMKNNDKQSTDRFRAKCDEVLHTIDGNLSGSSGAQYAMAIWLAWNWCFNGGPAALIERCKKENQSERVIQCSSHFPSLSHPSLAR